MFSENFELSWINPVTGAILRQKGQLRELNMKGEGLTRDGVTVLSIRNLDQKVDHSHQIRANMEVNS